MKINNAIITAALALGVAGSSFGGTVYISGSTAMRGTIYNVLSATNTVFNGIPAVTADSTSPSGANHMAFVGTLKGGSGTTTILTSWSGSEAGIANVASNTATAFYASFLNSGINVTSNSVSALNATNFTYANFPVDLAMADNDIQYSRTPSAYNSCAQAEVGIVTFKWVRNKGLWTGANTNVTDSQVVQALSGGTPLATFTGNAADTNSWVYVSGRDNQSGTRVNAFANAGYGIFTSPHQIILNGSGNMITNAAFDSAYSYYAGDFGQSSGGTLAGTLTNSTTSSADQIAGFTGFSVIAYLGYNDAATAIGGGATELAFNGVGYSPAAISEGTYTFWGNEYIVKAHTVGSTDATAVYNSIITNTPSFCYPTGSSNPNGIDLTWMHSTRNSPISAPAHN